jgi:hypothetical protein
MNDERTNKYGDPAASYDYTSDNWWTCADCGTDYNMDDGGDGFCPYCYISGTRHLIKSGNTVIYKGTNDEAADAAFDAAVNKDMRRIRWTRKENVRLNRPEDQPYEV